MEFEIFRIACILAATAFAAYIDHKTGLIYDYITIPLIILGIALNVLTGEFVGIAIAIAVFAFGYAMYYAGKIGGGDVKLYAGIAAMLPFFGGKVFILNAMLLGALAGALILSIYYFAKYFMRGIDFEENKPGILRAGLLLCIIALYFGFIYSMGLVKQSYLIFVGVPVVFAVLFVAFEKGIRREFFLKKINIKELEEDEIVALDFMQKEEKDKLKLGAKGVIGEKEKRELEKLGISEILVYRNLPRFGVFIFAGVALALAFPDFLQGILGV